MIRLSERLDFRLSSREFISLLVLCLFSGRAVRYNPISAIKTWLIRFMDKPAWGMTMASRPLSLPLHTYVINLAYGLVGAAFYHR